MSLICRFIGLSKGAVGKANVYVHFKEGFRQLGDLLFGRLSLWKLTQSRRSYLALNWQQYDHFDFAVRM